jgi:hypothetical protein
MRKTKLCVCVSLIFFPAEVVECNSEVSFSRGCQLSWKSVEFMAKHIFCKHTLDYMCRSGEKRATACFFSRVCLLQMNIVFLASEKLINKGVESDLILKMAREREREREKVSKLK